MGNHEKDVTLGMPHGTAANRLRKILLFECLRRHNENVCVRCQETIGTVDELSIEHIKPWESVSAELFWDLNNVAFSHMVCNRPHRCGVRPNPNLEHGTPGMWARGCRCEACKKQRRDYKSDYRQRTGVH
jgi:hypothetical protein